MPATVVHKKPAEPVSNDTAETIITQFIDSNEKSVPDGTANQLKRLQRDLRGLPPQALPNSTQQ